jgi:hypothetical protein
MDLTSSQPVAPGDEPFGEQPAQPAEAAALAAGPAATADSQPRPHEEATASRSSKEIGGKKFRVGPRNDYVPFRTRSKRKRRLIVTGVVVLVLIGAGAYGVGSLIGSPSQSPTASSCPAKANAAGDVANSNVAGAADAQSVALTGALVGQLPTAPQIKLNVYNSTNRHGLAATAATALKQRGFSIGKVTNDPLKANLTTAAEVRGASANAAAMRVVAAEVAGSRLHPDSRTDDSVDLVLGAGFTALASPEQVSAALKQAQQVAQAPQTQAAPPKTAGSKCS